MRPGGRSGRKDGRKEGLAGESGRRACWEESCSYWQKEREKPGGDGKEEDMDTWCGSVALSESKTIEAQYTQGTLEARRVLLGMGLHCSPPLRLRSTARASDSAAALPGSSGPGRGLLVLVVPEPRGQGALRSSSLWLRLS